MTPIALVRFVALLRLTRPHNGLITALSVGVGALCADASRWPPVLLAGLAAALVAGAGNAFNDVCDVEIDRLNRPGRPLPSGQVSRRAALLEALLLALAGIGVGACLSPLLGGVAAGVAAVLALYNLYLKRTPLWGNIAVAGVAALAFPYGALSGGTLGRAWIPAGFAFLYHLGRELVKDLEDAAGDRAQGARTLPLVWGTAPTRRLIGAVFFLLIVLTLTPYALGLYGLAYLLPVLLVDAQLLYALAYLYRRPTLPVGALSRRLLVGMCLGLSAVVGGELF